MPVDVRINPISSLASVHVTRILNTGRKVIM